jgi:tetratricopeptide (TPR) repeat protein
VVVTQAVYGLGGVGKSELALQYAHTHRSDYSLVWWITATDAARIEAGLAALAGRLCPAVSMAGTTADAAGWATGWLQAHDGWLLVVDNVEDPADMEPLLGQAGAGHVIVTTRRDTDWARLTDPVRLDILDPAPAVLVLLRRTGEHGAADEEAAGQIAAELGFLPLALDQAAAYILQQRITLAAYLDGLRRVPERMHAAASAGGDAQRTIARLWDLHITAIRHRSPAAARMLDVLARYAPDAVPRAMLGGDAPREETDEMLGLLASYSMITLTTETVSMHRLLQAVILTQPPASGDDPGSLRETALDWLNASIPADPERNMAGWPLLRALVPHAEALSSHFPPDTRPAALGRVQNQIALFLGSQGQHARALPMRQSALAIYQTTRGSDHPDTAAALGNLATAYREFGRYADAVSLQERALAITEQALGPDHPDSAIRLNNLADTYRALGRYADAVSLQERALAITEQALGPDHPHTAFMLGNLAHTFWVVGRYADAVPLEERALAISQQVFGPDHPDIAIRLGDLAITYQALGRYADALPLEERALAITEQALGPDHPDTALRLGNLAHTFWVLGRYADAVPLQERALAITERALGPDHPDTALPLNNLAATYQEFGRYADALPLQERALAITERALGPDHPDTALRLGNLAHTYRALERYADALPLEERALAITERALGPDHPTTALRLNNLAATYQEFGRHADAVPLQERALAITEQALGPDHPSTAIRLNNLAVTYQVLGRHADTVPLEERALAISDQALGPDHPTTALRLDNLAAAYRALGRHADAVPLEERAEQIRQRG